MDQDLRELLALWLGDHDPGQGRRDALLTRLRGDEEFRRAFLEEIRLLGMLRAVQSSEPRWLRLEDEIGWSARGREDVDAFAQKVVREGLRRLRIRRLVRWSAGVAAAVLVAGALLLAFRPGKPPETVEPARNGIEVATIIKVENVRWGNDIRPLGEGSVITPGRLCLQEGRLTLAFFSGVALTVEGPADVDLLAADRVFCRHGKLRARVPRGAEGFTVLAAGYEIVDLGTEFALNLEPGGKSRVMVFEGEAAVSVFGKDGHSVRGELLAGQRSIEVDANAGRIHDVELDPASFISLAEFEPAPLELDPGYAAAVLAAKPWAYWRFEAMADGRIRNEVEGRPDLTALGGVQLETSPGGNSCSRFHPDNHGQALLMDGDWVPPRISGYAIELWVQAELPSTSAFGQTALVGLIDRDDEPIEKHLAYLELTARSRRSAHEPCAIRFLDRWPAARSGGAHVFSRRTVVPSLWHHVVGQKSGDKLELYVDGEFVGATPAKLNAKDADDPVTTACRLLVGRLKRHSRPPHASEIRAFEGWLDELAVYDRPLTPEEIRQHAQLRIVP